MKAEQASKEFDAEAERVTLAVPLRGGVMHHDSTLEELWQTAPPARTTFDPDSIARFSPAVQRYLRHALAPGSRLATCARLTMTGTIRLEVDWCPFEAEQVLRWDRGFVWAARARVRGLPVRGFDRLVDGEGAMRWRLLGLLPVMTAQGADVSRSAAGRLHAEAIWIPAVFLGPGVSWSAPNACRAVAAIDAHGERSVLHLDMDEQGAVRACSLSRWGNLGNGAFEYHPFGAVVEAERTFDGITVPVRLRAGWRYGTPRFRNDGEFFRCTVETVTFR